MALSYGLSLNIHVIASVQSWCLLENLIVSVERLEQYMHIPSEAAEDIEGHRPTHSWPVNGRVKICDLKVNVHPKKLLPIPFTTFRNMEMYLQYFYAFRHCFS